MWVSTSVSGDCCYVGDSDCTVINPRFLHPPPILSLKFQFSQKHGPRMKCSACKIIAHASCISVLMERSQLACKPTFRDVGVRQYREQTRTHHHWIHRRTEKGKCRQCGKVSNVIHAVIDLNCTLSMSNYPHGALSKFVVTQREKKNGKTVFQFEYS